MSKHVLVPITQVHEVSLHYKRPLYNSMVVISSAKDAVKVLRECIDLNTIDLREDFWVLYLNQAHRLLAVSKTGEGCTEGVLVNIKAIFQIALRLNASAMILCHNHPSGALKPSSADKKVTKKIYGLSKIMGITLLDHIIVTSESFFSFQGKDLI